MNFWVSELLFDSELDTDSFTDLGLSLESKCLDVNGGRIFSFSTNKQYCLWSIRQ